MEEGQVNREGKRMTEPGQRVEERKTSDKQEARGTGTMGKEGQEEG